MLVKISIAIVLSMFRTETANGNIWEIGDELSASKTYSVTFDTNGTLDKVDDMVISVKEVK